MGKKRASREKKNRRPYEKPGQFDISADNDKLLGELSQLEGFFANTARDLTLLGIAQAIVQGKEPVPLEKNRSQIVHKFGPEEIHPEHDFIMQLMALYHLAVVKEDDFALKSETETQTEITHAYQILDDSVAYRKLLMEYANVGIPILHDILKEESDPNTYLISKLQTEDS
jgi:preprotein translocase subunit Sec63